jgi:hypothetical protein
LFSNEDLYQMGQIPRYYSPGEMIATCVLGVLFYGFAAAGLTTAVFSMFDAVVDRPDRLRQNRTPRQQQEYLKGRGKIVWKDL